jgi:hypothetical protein
VAYQNHFNERIKGKSGEGKTMPRFTNHMTVRAFVYFKDPSGRRLCWRRAMYDLEPQECARLQKAVAAYQQGVSEDKSYTLRLKSGHEVVLTLAEVDDLIHERRGIAAF